jgi:2-amino-4-hydroxy-6-hydroxymethyldihydropteridine diphosphokinase
MPPIEIDWRTGKASGKLNAMSSTDQFRQELRVVIALGSNLGDSVGLLRDAVARLGKWSATPVICSSLWRTSPVDCPPGSPPFVNCVAMIAPLARETPENLLGRLQELERAFGRRPKVIVNEARPLDLDLILWGDEVRAMEHLTLPHPRALSRQFVLRPLVEIAPELVFPGRSETVADLLEGLRTDEVLVRVGD